MYKTRFYKNEFPEVDEVVMCRATLINPTYVNVELLEYNGLIGMVGLRDLSERRVRNIRHIITVGRDYPMLVIRVDKEKGYVDLSNKYINEKDSSIEKFNRYKMVISIMNQFMYYLNQQNTDSSLSDEILSETMASKTIWKVDRNECYDLLTKIKINRSIPDLFELNETESNIFMNCINKNIKDVNYMLDVDFTLSCPTINGVHDIMNALNSGMIETIEDTELKIGLTSVPNYHISCKTKDKDNGILIVNESFERIKQSIESNHGNIQINKKEITNSLNNEVIVEF